jgi:LysR family transcriptional regulator, glycine cleavage system transcriptional activator
MNTSLPVKALLAFDAAMRHNSFTLAAEELHVTPGAVGQQIQKLEAWLGVTLFTRMVRQINPTTEALHYWSSVQPALARLQHASEQLRLRQVNEVWLSMPPTLAAKWFAPRMAGFLAQRPDISLHLGATTAISDFERDRVDLAIRYFDGEDDSLEAALLYRDEARLYCAPDYVKEHRLQTPSDLVRATLLHTTLQPHWRSWLQRFSTLSDAQIDVIPSLHFDQSLLAIETARYGQGAVLSSAILTEAEIRDGILCEPFDCRLPVTNGYYVVHHKSMPLRPAALALKKWLLQVTGSQPLR